MPSGMAITTDSTSDMPDSHALRAHTSLISDVTLWLSL